WPLELATWRRSTTAAVQMTSTSLRRGMGWTPNRTMGLRPVPHGSTKEAGRAAVRAPGPTSALMAAGLAPRHGAPSERPRLDRGWRARVARPPGADHADLSD